MAMASVGRSDGVIWPQGLTNPGRNGFLTNGEVNQTGQFALLNKLSNRFFKIANFSGDDQKLFPQSSVGIFPVGHNPLLPRIR